MTTTVRHAARRARTHAAPLHEGDWRAQASCRAADPALFFPEGTLKEVKHAEETAKRVCGRCPVLVTCLQWAIDSGQHTGVWGGLTEEERRELSGVSPAGMTLCLNRQTWIEQQLAAGKPQRRIAVELGVTRAVLCRAIARFEQERAAGMEVEGVKAA